MNTKIYHCDFNLAFYRLAGKNDDYTNTSVDCTWYKDNKKIAYYDKKKECLYIYTYDKIAEKQKEIIAKLDTMEKRTQVEKEAEKFICEGKYLEAIELLNTLD